MNAHSQLFSLEGKTALVTGCSRGIGKEMAIALAEAGADIIGVSAMLSSHDSEVAEAVRETGRSFSPFRCDFSDRTAVYQFLSQVTQQFPVIDILVNNAGTIRRAPFEDHSDEMWDEVIETNLTAPFILSRELGKRMAQRGEGKIIFTASLLSYQGGVTVPGYAASKAGIARLVMSFANEWASKGVGVNGIAPGYIATDNTQALREDPARSKQILERIPQGRWGTAGDMKGVAVFLASRASAYVNGTIVAVDGGWLGR